MEGGSWLKLKTKQSHCFKKLPILRFQSAPKQAPLRSGDSCGQRFAIAFALPDFSNAANAKGYPLAALPDCLRLCDRE